MLWKYVKDLISLVSFLVLEVFFCCVALDRDLDLPPPDIAFFLAFFLGGL